MDQPAQRNVNIFFKKTDLRIRVCYAYPDPDPWYDKWTRIRPGSNGSIILGSRPGKTDPGPGSTAISSYDNDNDNEENASEDDDNDDVRSVEIEGQYDQSVPGSTQFFFV